MEKILITQTNGASAEDLSDAIGEFLKQQEDHQKEQDEKEELR